MLQRLMRPRVLVVLVLFAFAGFYAGQLAAQQLPQQAQHEFSTRAEGGGSSSTAAGPAAARADAADGKRMAAARAAARAISTHEAAAAHEAARSREEDAEAAADPPSAAAAPCRWPTGVPQLTKGGRRASDPCVPFVGLLVPCTSAKTCGRDGKCWESVDDTSLLKELLPSVFSTLAATGSSAGTAAAPGFDLVIYIGYDADDKVYDTEQAREQLPERVRKLLVSTTTIPNAPKEDVVRHLPRIGLRLVRFYSRMNDEFWTKNDGLVTVKRWTLYKQGALRGVNVHGEQL